MNPARMLRMHSVILSAIEEKEIINGICLIWHTQMMHGTKLPFA